VNDGDTFAFRTSADGAVSIRFHGRSVTVLRGTAAARFLTRVAATDAAGAQLEMAKATGNFRRGNERQAKARERGKSGR
jgi:hypothetical protein